MGLFRKKPGVQEMRASLGLVPGEPVAVHRYLPLLRDAVNGAAMYREPSEIADDMGVGYSATPQQKTAIVQTVMSELSSVKLRIDKLCEVRPETAQLLGVHVAATDYLQQFHRTAEQWGLGLRQEFAGNMPAAKGHFAESDRLGSELQRLRQTFASELRLLARSEKRLYSELGLPRQSLIRLSLA